MTSDGSDWLKDLTAKERGKKEQGKNATQWGMGPRMLGFVLINASQRVAHQKGHIIEHVTNGHPLLQRGL